VDAGLFSEIGPDGIVKNLRLTGTVSVTNNAIANAGAVAGKNRGKIFNISSSVNVSATSAMSSAFAGGIAGENGTSGLTPGTPASPSIRNSYSTGNVSAIVMDSGKAAAGGIVGYMSNDNDSEVNYCWAEGNISSSHPAPTGPTTNMARSGGIAGELENSTKIKLQNNVALNSTLSATNISHRIASYEVALGNDPIFANNFAVSYMDDGVGASWVIGPDRADGEDFGIIKDAIPPPPPSNPAIPGNWTAQVPPATPTAGVLYGPGWSFLDTPGESNPWQWKTTRPGLWFETAINTP